MINSVGKEMRVSPSLAGGLNGLDRPRQRDPVDRANQPLIHMHVLVFGSTTVLIIKFIKRHFAHLHALLAAVHKNCVNRHPVETWKAPNLRETC